MCRFLLGFFFPSPPSACISIPAHSARFWNDGGGLLDYEIHQPCLLAHLLSHLLEIQAGPSHQATQSSVSLYRNEPDWDPFQFHQVSTGAECGQDQRRDHVEPLCPGYEVCNGRSVSLRIRRLPLVWGHVCVCEWELRINDIRWLSVGEVGEGWLLAE